MYSPGGCSAQGSLAEIASTVFFSWWQLCATFAQITRWGALMFATEKITMEWISTLRVCMQPLVLTSTSGSTHTGFSSQQKSLYGVCWICKQSFHAMIGTTNIVQHENKVDIFHTGNNLWQPQHSVNSQSIIPWTLNTCTAVAKTMCLNTLVHAATGGLVAVCTRP